MKKNEQNTKNSLFLCLSLALSLSSVVRFFFYIFRAPMTADRAAAFKAALGQLNSQFAR